LDNTPKLVVLRDRLQWGPTKEEFPIAIVQDEFSFHPLRQKLAQRLKEYFEKTQKAASENQRIVQIVADRANRYDVIFNVSEFLQGAGVSRVVYVTSGLK
jgi:biopolymer transport protein ExbD